MGYVLSLFDRTGNWAEPYRKDWRDLRVESVDIRNEGVDVRTMILDRSPDVILAAPPCTEFAASGARYWTKRVDQVALALSNVDAVCRMVAVHQPMIWAIENPVGRLSRWLGPPDLVFHPWEFAGHADDPETEAYTKRTCLWGKFKEPKRKPVDPTKKGSKMHSVPDSKSRADIRSETPTGFARAFAAANPIMEIA